MKFNLKIRGNVAQSATCNGVHHMQAAHRCHKEIACVCFAGLSTLSFVVLFMNFINKAVHSKNFIRCTNAADCFHPADEFIFVCTRQDNRN